MTYFLVFMIAFAAAFLTTPLARRLSFRWHMVAEPGGRRQHQGRIPKLGGIPLLVGYLAAMPLIYGLLPPEGDDALRLRGVLLGTLIMFIGGWLDDRYDLPPRFNFAIQGAGALIAMSHIIFIELFTNPLTGSPTQMGRGLALLFSLFWMVGMMNAVNFLDGLDGLAAGVGVIALLMFAWHSARLEQVTVPLFPIALAGALVGFLPFNFAPARIYLGTAGVYLLGYNLATLAILSPAKIATALLVLAVPILDVAWRIVDRLIHKRSPFEGDRGHLHFLLADRGLPTRPLVLGYYLVAAALGLVAIFADERVKLITFILVGVLIAGLVGWLTLRGKNGD
ncbi:MAG: undecaprenyl/decaprenyl-phosphate alpha-N-acetylglucosaminyl 1-phosphate transferase [Anaerolineae bacterium]|nr:undecaprenyl/decaprenyl-phosphate alpha-N-acetylglucosaminyl 1-phosphate transferase [Anaerolineae bacterium]